MRTTGSTKVVHDRDGNPGSSSAPPTATKPTACRSPNATSSTARGRPSSSPAISRQSRDGDLRRSRRGHHSARSRRLPPQHPGRPVRHRSDRCRRQGWRSQGEPKRLAYGSPSGRGKQIENAHNLLKWGERRIVLGLGLDLALIADCARVAQLDPESDEYREAADRGSCAKEAAQANLAADRGTHVHSLLEAVEEGRDWVHLAERGEIVGIPVDVQHRLAAAWRHARPQWTDRARHRGLVRR